MKRRGSQRGSAGSPHRLITVFYCFLVLYVQKDKNHYTTKESQQKQKQKNKHDITVCIHKPKQIQKITTCRKSLTSHFKTYNTQPKTERKPYKRNKTFHTKTKQTINMLLYDAAGVLAREREVAASYDNCFLFVCLVFLHIINFIKT